MNIDEGVRAGWTDELDDIFVSAGLGPIRALPLRLLEELLLLLATVYGDACAQGCGDAATKGKSR